MAGINGLLFREMFKEELRLQRSFIGTIAAAFFPVMIFIMSTILAMAFPLLMNRISTATVLLILYLGFILYGLGVGALSFIGEEVMTRRLGQTSMLLQLPQWQPVSFKRTMGVFYRRTLIYIVYSIIPLIAGIAVAAPLANIPYTSVALLALTTFLTFMLGMSLSFLYPLSR